MSLPTLIVFVGGMRGTAVENALCSVLRAAALDLVEAGLATGAFSSAVLATDRAISPDDLPDGAECDVDREPFHFGRRLADLIRERRIERPFYAGAGGIPLMEGSDIAGAARQLMERDGVVIANNYFSADLVAWTPGAAIEQIDLPKNDNYLARLLHDQAGLESQPLPRTSATQFNVDSPADAAILKVAGGGGPRLRQRLDELSFDATRYRALLRCLVDPDAEVLLAGRVGSQVWQHLERETACRLRVFSEERGMRAAGREESGEARSLLAFHLREVGCRRFFDEVAEMADAACIDTRPLLAHLGIEASRPDRFMSDLGRAHDIADPFLRELTQAAGEAPIPIIFGGHSLVAGGLMLLTEAAWREEDARVLADS